MGPFLVTTDESYYTIVMGIQRMLTVPDSEPVWHQVMATSMLAMLPPVLIVIFMQRLFVKGLNRAGKVSGASMDRQELRGIRHSGGVPAPRTSRRS